MWIFMVLINLRGNLYIFTFQDLGGFFFPNACQRFTYNFPAVRAGHIPSPCCLNQVIFLRPDPAVFDPKRWLTDQLSERWMLLFKMVAWCSLSTKRGSWKEILCLEASGKVQLTCGTKTDSVAVVFQPCGFIHFQGQKPSPSHSVISVWSTYHSVDQCSGSQLPTSEIL